MNLINYENFYNKVGKENGWDFSMLKVFAEGVQWDFYEEVRSKSQTSDVLLDIGTGGGENLLKIAPYFLLLIGIDLSHEMVERAQSNLNKTRESNVRLFQMSSEDIQFPKEFFDVITCRHAPFSAREVAKVLKAGGFFLTQQVGEGDKFNLKNAFNVPLKSNDGTLKEKYMKELMEAGFMNIQSYDYNAIEYYQSPEDLIFLLKHTPIIPNFGANKQDFETLKHFIKDNQTKKGIQTNSQRFLIVAKK